MKRIISVLFALTFILTARSETFRINVEDFSVLTVVDGIGVDYYCNPDSAGWSVFECEPSLAPHIMFTNKKNSLTIQSDAEDAPIQGLPRVTVYSNALTKVENSGDSLLIVHSTVPVQSFKVKQIGNGSIIVDNIEAKTMDIGITAGKGSISIKGSADKASISNVSTGPIDATGLKVQDVKCTVFGPGNVHVTPTRQLTVYGAGSGHIIYRTKPEKVSNRSIGVKANAE
jgi:hypothetical protein